eukprot:7002146-Pyramimonas_sp.AAC.1
MDDGADGDDDGIPTILMMTTIGGTHARSKAKRTYIRRRRMRRRRRRRNTTRDGLAHVSPRGPQTVCF